jgi:hypothetical protein
MVDEGFDQASVTSKEAFSESLGKIVYTQEPPPSYQVDLVTFISKLYGNVDKYVNNVGLDPSETNAHKLLKCKSLLEKKGSLLVQLDGEKLLPQPGFNPFNERPDVTWFKRNHEIVEAVDPKTTIIGLIEYSSEDPVSQAITLQCALDLLLIEHAVPINDHKENILNIQFARRDAVMFLLTNEPSMAIQLITQMFEKRNAHYLEDVISEGILDQLFDEAMISLSPQFQIPEDPNEMIYSPQGAALFTLACLYALGTQKHNLNPSNSSDRWLNDLFNRRMRTYASKMAPNFGWHETNASDVMEQHMLTLILRTIGKGESGLSSPELIDVWEQRLDELTKSVAKSRAFLPNPNITYAGVLWMSQSKRNLTNPNIVKERKSLPLSSF